MKQKPPFSQALDAFFSLSELARFVNLHRTTLRNRLRHCESQPGPHGAICYRLRDALKAREHPLYGDCVLEVGRAWFHLHELAADNEGTDDPTHEPVRECADSIIAAVRKLQAALQYPAEDRW